MSPKIENPANLEISPQIEQVLQKIFARYQKIVIKKEFATGLSGGRVFEVRPIQASGAPELPTVVKLAPISLIQQEWQAYWQHIHHRLPHISPVAGKPVLLGNIGLGGLRYAMLGEGTFEVISLRDYFRQAETTADKLGLAIERLLRIMRSIWDFNHLYTEFYWSSGYGSVLPVNLLIERLPVTDSHLRDITPANLPVEPLKPGDRVCLAGFALHKINRDTQTITLKSPAASLDTPACFVRCRAPITEEMAAWRANHSASPLAGEVLETRDSRFYEEVRGALGEGVDPTGQTVQIADQIYLPNPLLALPGLLNQRREVKIAAIHGDLNLENILIEPETGMISLIDFAEAREDHVLHDLLRLETETLTRLIPEIVQKYNLPLAPTLAALYWQLHEATFQLAPTRPSLPHPDLQKPWTMLNKVRRVVRSYLADADDINEYYQGLILYLLGALKFKNLNYLPEHPLPKQAAFWGATLAYYLLSLPAIDIDQPPAPLAMLIDQLGSAAHISLPSFLIQEVEPPRLDIAKRQLAALPLDAIPTLGALPPGSRMPLSRNPLFVGREDDLRQLAGALHGDETMGGQIRTVVVTGLGGLGKTQLASEFVHRYGRFFAGGVFWLSFADVRAVPAEIAACGGIGAMTLRPDFEELPLEEQVNLVKAAWQDPLPRLLIFDNCEHPELLVRWRPTSGGCRVLATSRYADWEVGLGAKILPLEVLKRSESIRLLHEHRPDAAEAALGAIAGEVGDLPLALHLAGSYLARYRRSIDPDQYLAQLRDGSLLRHRSLQAGGVSPTGHIQNISRTIALSYDRLNPANPTDALALALLARAACLAPGEPIPYNLLMLTLDLVSESLDDRFQAEDAVARLAELGLLRSEANNTVRLHRLVVAFVQEAPGEAMAPARATVETALCKEAERLNEAGYPAALLPWQAHLRTVVNAAFDRDDEQAARLCHALSEHFRQIGDHARARVALERVVAIRQKIFGEEHEFTARSLTDLGIVTLWQGDLPAARIYLEQALAIQEKRLGKHHDMAVTLNQIGFLLQLQKDLDGARIYHERALAIRLEVFGEEHSSVAESLCNLAYLDYLKGDLASARPYLERALTIQQKVWGERHTETARVLSNLGELLKAQGDLTGAQTVLTQALEIQQKELGEEHPETARVLTNIGEVWQAQGHLTKARWYYERALRIVNARHGPNHFRTRWILDTLNSLDAI